MQINRANGLTVITTHINADFDALASMLAAQKLYPEAIVVFPGSHEKNIRNFFIDSMVYLFNMADIREVDFSRVRRLVLVDTRQPGRIGKFAALLEKPDIEVHIYDHHPDMGNDIRGDVEVVRPTGATVTLLTQILEEKGIPVTPDEATLMCLGIYEDTGSFTFASTTGDDFRAAATLLSRGANLNIVSHLTAREISPKQVGLLNEMIEAARHYNINGIEVVVSSVTTENYVPDFAFLVHKLVKMENIDVVFALAAMGKKVYLVARSRIPEVDVGAILSPLGGGGHPFAAAATVRGRPLVQVEKELLDILHNDIASRRLANDLMSSPAIAVRPEISCREASDLLTRYNINALLVTEPEGEKTRLLGFITRQIIEKALYHKLDHVPVHEYMTTDVATVGPESDLLEIQEKIIENKQRILPVIEKGIIRGVVTRTDLLNILVRQSQAGKGGPPDPMKETLRARTRNVSKFMAERLPRRILEILRAVGTAASEIGCDAFMVGGCVRDLFLYRRNEDLDIVIEGDGIAFARRFARAAGARIHSHEKFGTAVIIYPDGFKIDVASARLEYYKFPAALPTVEMSSIKLDLFRRDFTINTLAIQLNPKRFGILIDFYNAQKDIKEKTIRILHNLSFVEDPTRVFRAIRFEQRFGFSIGKLTSGLIKNAVKMDFFKRLSGRRVFSELRQIFEEENPIPAIKRLNDYELLSVIHPTVLLDRELTGVLNGVRKVLSWYDLLFLEESYMRWAVYFLAMIRKCDQKTTEEICERMELAPRHRTLFTRDRFEVAQTLFRLESDPPLQNSDLYHRLAGIKTELVLFMMAATKQKRVKQRISDFITRLRNTRPEVTGKDLKGLGIEPGPIYREILDAVLDAKLNGRLKTAEEEFAFARESIKAREAESGKQ